MHLDSCLVSKMEKYVALTRSEATFLADLEKEHWPIPAGKTILRVGETLRDLYVLKSGWALVRSRVSRGRSQILRIYLPGEIIGLVELGRSEALHSLQMHTKGVLCPFPRERMVDLYNSEPRLSALLTALGSLEQMAMREQIFSLSRRSAEDRLVEFLLSLQDRLHVANLAATSRFMVPFSQAQIGDVVGLTPVYVNRLLTKLRQEGRIEIERPYIRILDQDGMVNQVGFRSIYQRVDLDWFPSQAA